jgi:hypothetical protein
LMNFVTCGVHASPDIHGYSHSLFDTEQDDIMIILILINELCCMSQRAAVSL